MHEQRGGHAGWFGKPDTSGWEIYPNMFEKKKLSNILNGEFFFLLTLARLGPRFSPRYGKNINNEMFTHSLHLTRVHEALLLALWRKIHNKAVVSVKLMRFISPVSSCLELANRLVS